MTHQELNLDKDMPLTPERKKEMDDMVKALIAMPYEPPTEPVVEKKELTLEETMKNIMEGIVLD